MGDLAPLAQFAPPTSGAPGRMTRKQKAAVIVRLLLSRGLDVPLKELPEEVQAELTLLLGTMRHIDRSTLSGVVDEFVEELEAPGADLPARRGGRPVGAGRQDFPPYRRAVCARRPGCARPVTPGTGCARWI